MNEPLPHTTYTAFAGSERLATGDLATVATAVKKRHDSTREGSAILIFDDEACRPVELDLRGSLDEVLARLPIPASTVIDSVEEPTPRAPGRPKLGVVAREVTLLPRHWEWLGTQPGGASVTLRKLVEAARRVSAGEDRLRAKREAAYRFLVAVAGNEVGFEEATRALFGGDREHFEHSIATWPADVREHAKKLTAEAFPLAA